MESNTVHLVLELARFVAFWHLIVATYLVVFAEHKSPALMAIAFLKGLLGGCIYLIVLEPEWAFLPNVEGLLLPFTLVLLGLISIAFTWLIWNLYELAPPWVRLREIAERRRRGP